MAGTLEPVANGFMTPKEQIKGYTKSTSTGYSDARSVKGSPFEHFQSNNRQNFNLVAKHLRKICLMRLARRLLKKRKAANHVVVSPRNLRRLNAIVVGKKYK